MTDRKPLDLPAMAALLLALPGAACGQRQQPAAAQAAPTAAAGMTLEAFGARQERRMLSADTDGDGRVSRSEFLASARAGKGDPARRFDRLDRNGDGMLDKQEIAAVKARRFHRLDTNGDGVLTPAERSAAKAAAGRDGTEG